MQNHAINFAQKLGLFTEQWQPGSVRVGPGEMFVGPKGPARALPNAPRQRQKSPKTPPRGGSRSN